MRANLLDGISISRLGCVAGFLILIGSLNIALAVPMDTRASLGNLSFGLEESQEEASLQDARFSFYRAVQDADFIDQSRNKFSRLSTRVVAKMYLSVLKALEARDTLWPIKKNRLIREALTEIDQILLMNPEDFELRILRASTLFSLPAFFDRKREGEAELRELARNFEARTNSYPTFLRTKWLCFLLNNGLTPDKPSSQRLFAALGGNFEDLD